ncbi:MAG: Uma2 family endonuclease [Leptolyngbyaceae bacterium]|nr:Uma2 family endonuclease [Leptolyngbyaceae bacterium]
MIAQIEAQRIYSPEEYLEMESESEVRHEYIDGEIVPMAGAMPNHNRITRNLCTVMTNGLRGTDCEVFVADQRLWIPRKRIYTYPDVIVVQGELKLQEGRQDTITNPLVILEVLSESTQGHDRGNKFTAYRSIPDFQEYVLIDQYSVHVEHYAKVSARKWEFQEYEDLGDHLVFVSLKLEILLAEIYDKVKFESGGSEFR